MKLNEEQERFVSRNGNCLVEACPGSGKTRSICEKVILLSHLRKKADPYIVVITYTNRAAEEIISRVSERYNKDSNVWIGTIHSFCNEWIIRKFRNLLAETKHGYRSITESEYYTLISDLKKKYNIGFLDDINTRLNENLEPVETGSKRSLVLEYRSFLKENKLIDFDDILRISKEALLSNETINKVLAALFDEIIVDEYQDTQLIQYQILAFLVSANARMKISFVGDPNQAIYRNLGAITLDVDELEKLFGRSFELFSFAGCYRSTQGVVDYYRNYQVKEAPIKSLSAVQNDKTIIEYCKTTSHDGLGKRIYEIICKEIESGIAPEQICIAAPSSFDFPKVLSDIKRLNPEFKINSEYASPLKQISKLTIYPFVKVVLLDPDPRNLKKRLFWSRKIIETLELVGVSPLFVLESLNIYTSEKLAKNVLKIKILNSIKVLGNTSSEMISIVDNELTRLAEIIDRQTDNANYTFSELKSYFDNNEGVVVSSFHGLKGEEYDVIVCYGLLDDKIPHKKSKEDPNIDHITESKKILYVLFSRARHAIYFFSEIRTPNRYSRYNRSPFVVEP